MEKHIETFQYYFPANAAMECLELWKVEKFAFRISKGRSSKLGDFRVEHHSKKITISVNHDLNPYLFLFTFLHEVAHLRVFRKYSLRVEPHGVEWKNEFFLLMKPFMEKEVFPFDLLKELVRHMKNPKATYNADVKLSQAFMKFDKDNSMSKIFLSDIPDDFCFKFRGRVYRKITTNRSRALCQEFKTNVKFTIPILAEVEPVSVS